MLTRNFDDAFLYASLVHAGQTRKGTDIPYVGHLLSVAATVLEYGGDEDQAIAALLHDAAEDQGGEGRLRDIRSRFGERVARIVGDCSDSLAADAARKPAWRARKEAYIAAIAGHEPDSVLVSLADKVANARSILRDLRDPDIGCALWDRFNGKRDGTLWYYRSLGEAYLTVLRGHGLGASRIHQLALELAELAAAMEEDDAGRGTRAVRPA